MHDTWQDLWNRAIDPATPLDALTDHDLEQVAAAGATRAERERWLLDVRADELYAARRASRAATDRRYAARIARESAVRVAERRAAESRVRVPSEHEWHGRYPRRILLLIAAGQDADLQRSRPSRVRSALRRARRPFAVVKHPAPVRRRPRARGCRRHSGRRTSARSGDSPDGEDGGDAPPAHHAPRAITGLIGLVVLLVQRRRAREAAR